MKVWFYDVNSNEKLVEQTTRLSGAVNEVLELRSELQDALAEIARHHLDFTRIRHQLDQYERYPTIYGHAEALKKIRNVVG